MTQFGLAKQWGWHPPPQHKTGYANPNGGLTFKPHYHVPAATSGTPGGLASPPAGSFDPALEAARRQAQRGMHDTLADTATERHFGEKDLAQALRDIHTSASRKRQKLGIDFERGGEKISNAEADTRLKAERGQQDLQTKRNDLIRQFGELGHRQGEAANAAGVNDAGTQAASAAARARNQQIAEAPIATAEQRLGQDLATALSRLGVSREQLSQDRGIAGSQLKQDRERQRLLANREFNRHDFEFGRKEQRTRREGAISSVNSLEEEIYQAHKEHPGAFAFNPHNKGPRKGRH